MYSTEYFLALKEIKLIEKKTFWESNSVAGDVSNWNVYKSERTFKIFRLTTIIPVEHRRQLQLEL